jgi:hypothetical protein
MSFDEFWSKYPRKVAKKAAMQAYARLPMDEQELAVDTLDTHLEYWRLKETESDFIPHPATWLNQGRYFDELELKAKAPKKPALPWYSTEQMTMDKARELEMTPRPGEDMGQFRSRIAQKVAEQA